MDADGADGRIRSGGVRTVRTGPCGNGAAGCGDPALHGVGGRSGEVAGAFEVGAALEGLVGGAVLGGGADAFQVVELLRGHEAAGHAFGGLVDQAIPQFGGDRGQGLPRSVVALMALPRDFSAVKNDVYLILSLHRVADPPTKFHCHDGGGKGRGGGCASAKRPAGACAREAWGLRVGRGRDGIGGMILRMGKLLRLAWVGAVMVAGGATPRLAADLADDLARISVEAAGGAQAHAALRGFRATGVTRVEGREVSFILYAARPRSVRIETLGEKGSLVRAFDGVHAPWKKDDPLQPPRRLARAEEKDFILDADFDSPLYDHEARQISLDHAGEVSVGGRTYDALLATIRFTDSAKLYLDAETGLLARRDLVKLARGRRVVVETHYSGYRQVAGVRLPTRIRTEVDGRILHETVIEDYEPNPRLPKDFFAPPASEWPGF